ncbi:MAG TPA: vanadium-dependent haloperoxidase, partial [Ohtaekwangia sp.]|uniref:vanadium-dependent haloperoxidase n=1 Tax=Ohtaekwangia sp. TaxID=2066019 RepID=UPI002F91D231
PPVASRIYVYAHLAAYEVLVKENPSYKSLYGQIATLPAIAAPDENISYSLAAVSAYLATGKGLIFSENMLEDSTKTILRYYKKKLPAKVYESSIRYGSTVAESILTWSKQDRYTETRAMRRYTLLKEDGKWSPTPPVYMAAIEPYWRLIRTLTLDSAAQFKPMPPATFSKQRDSEFYKLAYHVYTTVNKLTPEQTAIANFWDCNPFAVNVHGHINYATKKLSPGGHWLSIAAIASKKTNASIMKASAAYTITAIALFDGFISCWDEKFRSNLIRPETYINAYIDEQWKPLLQTPPFPEHTSGHSVISTAAAVVLSAFFGDDFSFTDTSEKEYGYPARTFTSFKQASQEAAVSRLYGGIHYVTAIEQGQLQGQKVGEYVLQKIKLLNAQ